MQAQRVKLHTKAMGYDMKIAFNDASAEISKVSLLTSLPQAQFGLNKNSKRARAGNKMESATNARRAFFPSSRFVTIIKYEVDSQYSVSREAVDESS